MPYAGGNSVGFDEWGKMSEESTPVSKRPKWEQDTAEKVRASLRKFAKPLADLIKRDANEGDTRLLITDMLCEGLGWDKYAELTTEYQVKGEFADYGVRLDQQLIAFIEVKRATTKLNSRHLRQVEMYAVNEGVEWLILTNGWQWQVFRLIPGMPVTIDLVLDVNLISDESIAVKAAQMFYLHKESLKRGQIEEVWKARAATAPKALASAILSETVLNELRKEVKRRSGHTIDSADLGRLVRDSVLVPELAK